MCHGNNIFQLVSENKKKPFYAAIASNTERSLQTLHHNQELYKKCLKKDLAIRAIETINYLLESNQGRSPYELRIV